VRVRVAGDGDSNIETGVPVLDHLLVLLASHAGFDLALSVEPGSADAEIDAAGRALGEALEEPLRAEGARGHGSAAVPADEALAHVALEASGRPLVVSNVDRPGGALPRPADAGGGGHAARAVDRRERDAARPGGDLQGAWRGARTGVRAPWKGGGVTEKEVVRTEAAPAPFQGAPYSQAVKAGGLVFVSGQLALEPGHTELMGGTIQEQTEQVFANLRAILEEAGTSVDRLVKTTVFLQNLDDFQGMNEVYARHVGDTPPARSTVEVARLPSGALVEIEAVALL
jgi:2-iminobutanoate/2-iminopropanoate deaminase